MAVFSSEFTSSLTEKNRILYFSSSSSFNCNQHLYIMNYLNEKNTVSYHLSFHHGSPFSNSGFYEFHPLLRQKRTVPLASWSFKSHVELIRVAWQVCCACDRWCLAPLWINRLFFPEHSGYAELSAGPADSNMFPAIHGSQREGAPLATDHPQVQRRQGEFISSFFLSFFFCEGRNEKKEEDYTKKLRML